MFAMLLHQELEEQWGEPNREILALNDVVGTMDASIIDHNDNSDDIHVILVSVTGVGEPPDNARKFYDWLMKRDLPLNLKYTLFGLGNSIAHPKHYNTIAKSMDSKLQELGAQRVYPIGLGDDGDCIEDDFDQWMEGLLRVIRTAATFEALPQLVEDSPITGSVRNVQQIVSSNTKARNEPLVLKPPVTLPAIHKNLMHVPFYQNDVDWMEVVAHRALSVDGGEQGLRELYLQLAPNVTYEAGDHVILYPRNSRSMVDAFLQLYKSTDQHSVIVDGGPGYPHPTGISVYEALTHCVDLGALPSPSLARYLLQADNIDYKGDIAAPRRTILNLIHEVGIAPPLQDLLHMLPKMQPRYYSIASSPKVHPHQVVVTYRPVKYVSSTGCLREGVCTSYMLSLTNGSHIVGGIRSNPSFRLPSDLQVPIIMIAGGCGIAPIRAFLEDRVASLSESDVMGESMLFLGFRSPSDQVYQDLIDHSLSCGALSTAYISYSQECISVDQRCQLVTQSVREHGSVIMDWIENRGAHVYLCGGARSFGAAVEATFVDLLEAHNGLDPDGATEYLRQIVAEGRLCEDLAD